MENKSHVPKHQPAHNQPGEGMIFQRFMPTSKKVPSKSSNQWSMAFTAILAVEPWNRGTGEATGGEATGGAPA